MYYLKHAFNILVNPLGIALTGLLIGAFLLAIRRRRYGLVVFALSFAWLWFWSARVSFRLVGVTLERPYLIEGRVPKVETFPVASAIALLGGGMGVATNVSPYAEMYAGADRAWQAARLYHAGRAPKIITSGASTELSEVSLLRDFGVPSSAIVSEDKSRNTEENALFVQQMLLGSDSVPQKAGPRPKVLVVTSAWHMARAMRMFERYAPEIESVPAPSDFEFTVLSSEAFEVEDILPSADSLAHNSTVFKEWCGLLAYRLIKR